MKQELILIFSIFCVFFLASCYPHTASAYVGFGGKIISTTIPSVTCTSKDGKGPITILGAGASVPSPYVNTFTSVPYGSATLSPGKWILGTRSAGFMPSDLTTCKINTPSGQVPFPVYSIGIFGTK